MGKNKPRSAAVHTVNKKEKFVDKWKRFCIITIYLVLFIDLMCLGGFLYLDNSLAETEIIVYHDIEITRIVSNGSSEIVYGRYSKKILMADVNDDYFHEGDIVNFYEKNEITKYTHHIINKEISVGRI